MDVPSRRAFAKDKFLCFNCLRGGHTSTSCNSKKFCQKCRKRHHTLVHLDLSTSSEIKLPADSNGVMNTPQSHLSSHDLEVQSSGKLSLVSNPMHEEIDPNCKYDTSLVNNHSIQRTLRRPHSILPTALVFARDINGKLHSCRILLDSGSQVSFVTEAFASKLGLPRQHARIPVTGLSSIGAGTTRGVIYLELLSRFNEKSIGIEAYLLTKLTSFIPNLSFNVTTWDYINTLQLADPMFNAPGPIDVLLGADKLFSIFENGRIHNGPGKPIAQLTSFGWVIAGELPRQDIETSIPEISCSITSLLAEADIDRTLRRFWEVEEIQSEPALSEEEQIAENHFAHTYSRSIDGRYTVKLPFRRPYEKLGDSLDLAIRRLYAMERRFMHNPPLRDKYTQFMKDYLLLGHMERIPQDEIKIANKQVYYLPHHSVLKPDSSTTKLRVVFDGSGKPANGASLNEALLAGPSLLRDLFSVCLRFRRHRFVFTSDIEKMYRQIWVSNEHTDYQRIVWRNSSSEAIQHYRLRTITYGTSCAPFLAVRSLHQLAIDCKQNFPEASQVILTDFYMDDVMTGADDMNGLLHLKEQLTHVLNSAGFQLRKWSTNCWSLLSHLPKEDCEQSIMEFDQDSQVIKVLGLRWHPSGDTFSYKVTLPTEKTITKRYILSTASRIFDPLGFLSPAIVNIKILFQQLWMENLGWDDIVTQPLADKWLRIRKELPHIEKVKVPRRIWTSRNSVELHAFCDASELAYAAVIYL